MLTLSKPDEQTIREFLASQSSEGLSYAEVGATNGCLPYDYARTHTRIRVGKGHADFGRARQTLENYEQFCLPWVFAWPTWTIPELGVEIAIVGKFAGIWWSNACRIVTVIDEKQEKPRFGYSVGTLPDHVARGEERFLVEMDDSGCVWMDILSFSRPNTLLAKLGYPIIRSRQRSFGRSACERVSLHVTAQRTAMDETADSDPVELVAD